MPIYIHMWINLASITFWDNSPNNGTNDPKHFSQAQLVQISVRIFLVSLGSSQVMMSSLKRSSLFLIWYASCDRRGGVLGSWCYPCGSPSWVVHLSSWTWVLPFCSLFSLLFGALVNFWLAWFHHLGSLDRRFQVLGTTIGT